MSNVNGKFWAHLLRAAGTAIFAERDGADAEADDGGGGAEPTHAVADAPAPKKSCCTAKRPGAIKIGTLSGVRKAGPR